MPKDYRLEVTPANEQRRPKNAMDDEWTRAFMERVQVGHVGSRWEDQPFVTPTSFWYDPERHTIYFHSNIVGRMRANLEAFPRACFEAFEAGQMLPSNVALEFTVQYESVMAYGVVRILDDPDEQCRALYGLIRKYFPEMEPGDYYRPITDEELARTTVYAFEIESWSGKRNWAEQAKQSPDWKPLEVR